MNIIEINNRTRSKIDFELVRRVTDKFLRQNGLCDRELSIAFVGDIVMRRLNGEYRKKDKVTDVLAFSGEGNDLGEIIIDYAQIKRQAKKFSPNSKEELVFILVHALLHLLGYDDVTAGGRAEMIALGEKFIKKLRV
ncbi:MAG: rRNA maturation RNase YbeY [Candidatus Falkowbacteria bacterium]